MEATQGELTRPDTGRRRSRMVRAILAGGLVLGIGTAVTLAAWNDSEFVTNTFTAGQFSIEGAVTDPTVTSTFSEHATVATAGAVTYTLPQSNLSPNQTILAPYAVRTVAGTNYNATVGVYLNAAANTTGTTLVSNLGWAIYPQTSWGCTNTSTGVIASQAIGALAVTNTPIGAGFNLTKGGAAGATAGAPQYLCFVVTTGAGLAQNAAGTVTWEFRATSN
jgi:predicted ribosomally synthesized peptide with SipW-like signal peptide